MATPTLVSLASSASSDSITGAGTTLTFQLPEPSTAGNLLLAFIFTNTGTTIGGSAVTDDQSQTWTSVLNGVGGLDLLGFVYKFENTAAGVRKVSIAMNQISFATAVLIEVFNVPASTTIGKTWSNDDNTSQTAWTSGAAQTPTAGSSIYQFAHSSHQPWFSAGVSTADTAKGYRLECDNLCDGVVGQSWEGVTATSHSPTITVNTAVKYLSMAIEVLAGSGGADGPTFRMKRAQWSSFNTSASTFPWHLPTDGNLILLDASPGVSPHQINSISGVTFTEHGASPLTNGVGGTIQHFHADNVTASRTANNGTVTLDDVGHGSLCLYDILGAAASPLDTGATGSSGLSGASGALSATGNQTVAGNLTVGTITPSSGTRMIHCILNHNSGSETGMNDATINFPVAYAGQDGGSGPNYESDVGIANKVVSSAVSLVFTRSATAASLWEALAAAYLTAAGGGDTLFAQAIF